MHWKEYLCVFYQKMISQPFVTLLMLSQSLPQYNQCCCLKIASKYFEATLYFCDSTHLLQFGGTV